MGNEKISLGLIGFPLTHSRSPGWFKEKFAREGLTNAEYHLFPLTSVEQFPLLLMENPTLQGLNVTIPYKVKIIPYLDELDETARMIGAVNTIRISLDGGAVHTKGFNTDSPGFLNTISHIPPRVKALILGTGGAARAVAHAFKTRNISFKFVSRLSKGADTIHYDDLEPGLFQDYRMIVNTTPLGMFPDTGTCAPIPYQLLTPDHVVYDLVYNPEETTFLRHARLMHAQTINGMQMLINQAEYSFKIMTGKP